MTLGRVGSPDPNMFLDDTLSVQIQWILISQIPSNDALPPTPDLQVSLRYYPSFSIPPIVRFI